LNIAEIDQKIQLTGGKAAGAAKLLLRTLLKRGPKGYPYKSLKIARGHSDVRILLDLGYAQWEGGRLFIEEKLGAELQPKKAAAKRKKEPNKKKAFLWREK